MKQDLVEPSLDVVRCGEEDRDAWEAFVAAAPDATLSHLYVWCRIISGSYGHKAVYLMARRSGCIAGVLPLIQVKSRLFGNVLSSMPFQDYGGIVAGDPEAAKVLLQHALRLKNECAADYLELRHRNPVLAGEGSLREHKATLILDISSGGKNLWKVFSGKVRNQVRKAEKSGLATHLGGAELLDEFYRVFAVNMRDLGSPVHHAAFFARIFSEFGDNARILVVRDGKRTVGGLIGLMYKDTMTVPWASSLRDYFGKCPNNLLYWDAIQCACERGCKFFDFGRSSIGSGTYHFKLQWGAQPIKLHWQVFDKDRGSASAITEDARFRLASGIWKRLPVSFATFLGPHLRKYITN
jgi:FemAB-related protein (PEP-CTERM system-associated)